MTEYICFCDGGCYTRKDKTTTPSYFSFQIWAERKLQQYYNRSNTRPEYAMNRFYLRGLIDQNHQIGRPLTGQITVSPHEQLVLPGKCSIYNGNGQETNNIAEYAALYYTLATIYENMAFEKHIHIYTDSNLVVQQMNGLWKCKQPHLQRWMSEGRLLADKIKNLQIKHVGREHIEKMLGH